jgi:hypothetical protein
VNRFLSSFLNDQILRAFAIAMAFQVVVLCLLAIPFWLIWNALAPVYGVDLLPVAWQHMPYWHVVGLFALPRILVAIFQTKIEFQ